MKSVKIKFIMVSLFVSKAVFAQPPVVANICVGCHGAKGVSPNQEWPNLANQKHDYLIDQLKSFRSGRRYNPLMSPVAKMLSDNEIDQLAEYFSKIEGEEK